MPAMLQWFARHRRLYAFRPRDEAILLRLKGYQPQVAMVDGAECFAFAIIDQETQRVAGELAFRLGEGEGLFYLGHVGYHVYPTYRGRGYAARACRLCIPLLQQWGITSLVITTDDDNMPSISTCQRLGCQYESLVDVPNWCQAEYGISHKKRRYIWVLARL